jgi:hypothetical protein
LITLRPGRIAAYVRLPQFPTADILHEHAILQRARQEGWQYVRFFRDRHDTWEQWVSLCQAVNRGEVSSLLLMSYREVPEMERASFAQLMLRKRVRLLTVTDGIDSFTPEGRLWLMEQALKEE